MAENRPSRAPALLLGLLALLVPLAGLVGAHSGDHSATPAEISRLELMPTSLREVIPDSLGAHGTEVVFATPSEDGSAVELVLLEVTTGTFETLTRIGRDPGDLTFDSLDLDGRFVAWSDDRSGRLQVYALDRETGAFSALTRSGGDERQVRIGDGTVVWASWGNYTVWSRALPDGPRVAVAGGGAGPASAPDTEGGRIVWSRSVNGTNFEVFYRNLTSGEVRRLSYDALVQVTPRLAGNSVVWVEAPSPDVAPDAGSRIVLHDLETNVSITPSGGFGAFQRPVASEGFVAWLVRPAGIAVYDRATSQIAVVPAVSGATTDVVLSDDVLAFTLRGPDGLLLYADQPGTLMALHDPQSPATRPSWALLAAGGGLVVAGLAYGAWRRVVGGREGPEGPPK